MPPCGRMWKVCRDFYIYLDSLGGATISYITQTQLPTSAYLSCPFLALWHHTCYGAKYRRGGVTIYHYFYLGMLWLNYISAWCILHIRFLPERDYVTFGSLLSLFRLSSVCNVRAPYSGGWTFRQYFFTAVYRGHPLTSVQNFTEIVPG